QWQGEEADACIQIERNLAASCSDNRLQQVLDQKAIHLKKREVAHAVAKSAGFMKQIARAAQIESIRLLVQQQQAVDARHGAAKRGGQFGCGLRKLLERNVERNLFVTRIGERLDFQHAGRQLRRTRHFLQLMKRLQQARRQ